MRHFEKLMNVADTKSYGNYTAVAQYWGNTRIEIDIYLYRTLICVIGLHNHTFELTNYDWTTNTTLKALKEWKEYLQNLGYKLVDLQFTGSSPDRFNLAVRVPANAHQGGYIMKDNHILQCNHVGKSDRQLQSLPVDEFYISSPVEYELGMQPRGCYMRGRNEKEIAKYVADHRGIEFTLYFDLPDAPAMYGIWINNEQLYLFKFKAQKIAYYRDFQSVNVTYTATEIYKAINETPLNLARMIGVETCAYNLYNDMLNQFECLS